MKTILFITILLFSCPFLLDAHEEFYKKSLNDPCETADITTTYNNGLIITWQQYLYIPVAADWTLDFPTFDQINVTNAGSEFINAVDNWNTFAWENLFDRQAAFGYNVHVRFADSEVLFPDGQIRYGVRVPKFEEVGGYERYLPYSSFCQGFATHTSIYLNSRTSKGFVWIHGTYIPPIQNEEMTFEYTVSHELGHVLGLGHCSKLYPETIMHGVPPYDEFAYPQPRQYDIDGLNIMATQDPVTPSVINPLSRFFNRHHSFFEHEPDVLIYSQKKTGNSDNNEKSPNQTTSPYSEKNLFTIPKSETYKQEYLEGAEK